MVVCDLTNVRTCGQLVHPEVHVQDIENLYSVQYPH